MIADKVQVHIGTGAFNLLQAQYIGVDDFEKVLKAFLDTGAKPIDIP